MSSAANLNLTDFAAARRNMIEGQIRPNKVRDERVLTVLENLPRELFVPEKFAGVAYIDESMPVAAGRYLLQPMVLARFLEELGIKPTDRILDISPATGYSTAALARLGAQVVAVEQDAALQARGMEILKRLEITNADIRVAPGAQGWRTQAPYDVILVNGAVDEEPDMLMHQLADGGRMAVVVRSYAKADAAHTGEARIYLRQGGVVSCRPVFDANVAVLPGFSAAPEFRF